MKHAGARTTYLRDYRPPVFNIETTELHFDLHEDRKLQERDGERRAALIQRVLGEKEEEEEKEDENKEEEKKEEKPE